MVKPMAVGMAILAVAASSTVYAQQYSRSPGGGDEGSRVEQQYRPTAEDIKAFSDARIAALKAGLQLTPDQEANWPPFEQAVRDLAKLREETIENRGAGNGEQSSTNPFNRMQRRADALSRLGTALKRVADTGAPLYQSLTDAQKQRFRFFARVLRPHWMAGDFWQEHREVGNDGRGGRFDGGPRHMMGRDREDDGRRGMMGRDRDEDSNDP
jgi:zinc resistance-associated protein